MTQVPVDKEMRVEALRQAAGLSYDTPDQIVPLARKFYKFLTVSDTETETEVIPNE